MITFEETAVIGKEHLDAGGHANWIMQQTLAQDFHYRCRRELGFGLETLLSQRLFFVMRQIEAKYYMELFEGDNITLHLTIKIIRHTQLSFEFAIRAKGKLATEVNWLMPLISLNRPNGKARPVRLPKFIVDVIEKTPEPQPA